jgi:hypothetical protein
LNEYQPTPQYASIRELCIQFIHFNNYLGEKIFLNSGKFY